MPMITMNGRSPFPDAEREILLRMRWRGLDGGVDVARRILGDAIDLARVNPNTVEECVEFIIESDLRAPCPPRPSLRKVRRRPRRRLL